MLPLLGMIVVFCSVIGGFALENGRFAPLIQPSEVVMIFGAAAGTLLTANPVRLLGSTARALGMVFRATPFTREFYLATLVMLYGLFQYARHNGSTKFEDQLDDPGHSAIFRRHAAAIRGLAINRSPDLAEAGALSFLCDTLRLTTLGISPVDLPFDMDEMLEQDFERRQHELRAPGAMLASLADALPGLGILSAVLGIVVTMGSVTDLPKIIGNKVGCALVGTFFGIFLSYGFVGPLAEHATHLAEAELAYYEALRGALLAFARGLPTPVAVEFARRAIPPGLRPSFGEMEKACHDSRKVVEMPAPVALAS